MPHTSVKYLGLILQDDLGWTSHVSRTSTKVFTTIKRLQWRRGSLSQAHRRRLITALAIPHVRYAAAVFTDMPPELQRRMQHLLNACVRFIKPVPRFTPVSPTRKSLRLPTYITIHHRAVLGLLHKLIFKDPDASFLTSPIARMSPLSPRLRELRMLHPPTEFTDRSFAAQAARVWNKLPAEVRRITSHKSFVRRLKTGPSLCRSTMDRSLIF